MAHPSLLKEIHFKMPVILNWVMIDMVVDCISIMLDFLAVRIVFVYLLAKYFICVMVWPKGPAFFPISIFDQKFLSFKSKSLFPGFSYFEI